jgi:YD repeat-containing protein
VNRLESVETAEIGTTSYEYDPVGRLSKILRANRLDSTYTYDSAGRLQKLVHATAENELASYQYQYDDVGNRIQAIEDVIPPSGLTAGTYDDTDAAWIYSGDWATYNGTGPYADTLHYSTTVGNSAEVYFTGEQFSLTYTALADRGVVDVYVDNVKVVSLNEGGPGSWQQRWFSDPLAPGNHTLRIVHASGGVVDIDAITIIETANILLPAAPYCSRPTGIPILDQSHMTTACTTPSALAKVLSSALAVSNSNCSIHS